MANHHTNGACAETQVTRRRLLSAAPALGLAGLMAGDVDAAVAQLLPEATPIEDLFPQWEAAKAAYNAFDEIDDETDSRLQGALKAIEDEILIITPRTVREYAFKLIVLNDFADLEGVPWGTAMMAEARALIGGAA